MRTLFFACLCLVVHGTLDADSIGRLKISDTSRSAYKKYLDDTCQTGETFTLRMYLEWEEHEFVTSLRKELLPETRDGDLRSFVRSDLSKYLPISPLVADPRRLRCRQAKKAVKNVTDSLSGIADSRTAFQDYIIDLTPSYGIASSYVCL